MWHSTTTPSSLLEIELEVYGCGSIIDISSGGSGGVSGGGTCDGYGGGSGRGSGDGTSICNESGATSGGFITGTTV